MTNLNHRHASRLTRTTLAISAVILCALTSGRAQEKSLVTFKGSNGQGPLAAVIFDAEGNLYGTTCEGGANGNGIVFKLTPNAHGPWKETVLYSFPTSHNPKNPWGPASGVIFDAAGNLYGTTYYGGSSVGTYYCPMGCGTVYRLTPTATGTWKEATLYSFKEKADGGSPNGGLVFDSQGNLYGTATYGGSGDCVNGCGTVFELSPTASGPWKQTVLHSFTGSNVGGDGEYPWANLTFDTVGNLYGTTFGGGTFANGSVFELSPNGTGGWNYEVIHSFPVAVMNGTDGSGPLVAVIADASGNLYGTTIAGGSQMLGAVFELSPGSGGWTSTLLYSFQGLGDGYEPKAPLVFDAAGNLYGTVSEVIGGVFELSPTATGVWTESNLYEFQTYYGATPVAGLILDSEGNLYGTTEFGGSSEDGVVFEIAR